LGGGSSCDRSFYNMGLYDDESEYQDSEDITAARSIEWVIETSILKCSILHHSYRAEEQHAD